jgi:hypothetical protein
MHNVPYNFDARG